jgi:outer membrane protein assembly factor BamB
MYRSQPTLPVLVTTFGGRIFGLDPATGRRLWVYETSSTASGNRLRLAVLGDRVYAIVLGDLHILEYLTGRHLRSVPVPNNAFGTLMILEGRVYSGGNGAVACFALDGTLLWTDDFKGMGVDVVSFAVPGYSVEADH